MRKGNLGEPYLKKGYFWEQFFEKWVPRGIGKKSTLGFVFVKRVPIGEPFLKRKYLGQPFLKKGYHREPFLKKKYLSGFVFENRVPCGNVV